MKTAPAFHVYVVGDLEPGPANLLAELGLDSLRLGDPADVVHPALILVSPGQQAPVGLDDITIAPPADSSPAAMRELLRVAMENVVLKRQVSKPGDQRARGPVQFRDLNRYAIAPS